MSNDSAEGLDAARAGHSSRISINAILNATGSLSYYVAVVLITPLAIGALGEHVWGIWQLVGAVTSYALLVDLGLQSAVSYHVAAAVANDDAEGLGKSIHTARTYMLGAGLSIAVVFVLVGSPLVSVLVPESDHALALRALLCSTVLTGLTLPWRAYSSVIFGIQRLDLIARFRLGTAILLFAVVASGFWLGRLDLLGFVVVMSVAPVAPGLLSWIAARRLFPRSVLAWRRMDWPYLREMFAYSINTVLYTTGSTILYQSLKVLAAWTAGGTIAAARMGLAVSIVQILSVLFVPLVSVIQPRAADLANRGRADQLAPLLHRSLATIGAVATPIILFIAVEGTTLFSAWVGNAVDAEGIASLARTSLYMLPGQWLFIVFLPCFYALAGLGEHRGFGVMMIGTGVLNAAGGALAALHSPSNEALALVFSGAMTSMVVFYTVPVALRRFSIGLVTTLRDALAVPVVAALPGVASVWIRPRMDEPLLDLIVAGVGFGLLALPGFLLAIRRVAPGRAI